MQFPSSSEGYFDQPTDHGRKVIHMSLKEAERYNHKYIGTEHFLLAFV